MGFFAQLKEDIQGVLGSFVASLFESTSTNYAFAYSG